MLTAGGINAGGVAGAKLADLAVTEAKLAAQAVTAAKIAAGAVSLDKLAADAADRMNPVVLWDGMALMHDSHKFGLNGSGVRKGTVSGQPHGIVMVFSRYDNSTGTALNRYWSSFFVPKQAVASAPGTGHCFFSATTDAPAMAKYVYISDTQVWGCDDNNKQGSYSGITYDNRIWVLRKIIGV